MLRALTSYFFGGIEEETPEAPIECETREVNDWLVVNLPDHNKDSINLNDDDDSYVIDDEDVGIDEMDDDDAVEVDASDVNEMDLEEDDILMSLSILMMPPEDEQPPNQRPFDCRLHFDANPVDFYSYPYHMIPPLFRRYCEDIDNNKSQNDARTKNLVQQIVPVQQAVTQEQIDKVMKDSILDMVRFYRSCNKDIVKEYRDSERKDKVVNVYVIDITPPPAHYKSYVNHRHPEKLLNYDILQRIKELEPEQHAAQRSIKKNLTRGQLNRQNKNYMYETSSKRNRRCNRQRNPSGANNNRKC